MVREWTGREAELRAVRDAQAARYREAANAGDASVAATIVGEAVGLIQAIEPAAGIVERIVAEAEALLKGGAARVE
jgi:nitronate monooxygenase